MSKNDDAGTVRPRLMRPQTLRGARAVHIERQEVGLVTAVSMKSSDAWKRSRAISEYLEAVSNSIQFFDHAAEHIRLFRRFCAAFGNV